VHKTVIPALYYCLSQNGHGKTSGNVGPLYPDIHKQRINCGNINWWDWSTLV